MSEDTMESLTEEIASLEARQARTTNLISDLERKRLELEKEDYNYWLDLSEDFPNATGSETIAKNTAQMQALRKAVLGTTEICNARAVLNGWIVASLDHAPEPTFEAAFPVFLVVSDEVDGSREPEIGFLEEADAERCVELWEPDEDSLNYFIKAVQVHQEGLPE